MPLLHAPRIEARGVVVEDDRHRRGRLAVMSALRARCAVSTAIVIRCICTRYRGRDR